LNDTESKFIYKQVTSGSKPHVKITPSVLELENDDTRIMEVSPFPIIEARRSFQQGARIIKENDRNFPRGQFYLYQPNDYIQNFEISFGGDFRVFCLLQTPMEDGTLNILDSPPSENLLIQDIKDFCARKEVYTGEYTYNSIDEFLHLISLYYKAEYPGRIITLMLLSCRVGEYDTVEELTQDINVLSLNIHKGNGIGYVRGPKPDGLVITGNEHGINMKDAYMYDPNPGPDAYTKGIYINKLVLSKDDAIVVPLNSGGGRNRRRRNAYRRTKRKRGSMTNKTRTNRRF
jgi:hypothetical protein